MIVKPYLFIGLLLALFSVSKPIFSQVTNQEGLSFFARSWVNNQSNFIDNPESTSQQTELSDDQRILLGLRYLTKTDYGQFIAASEVIRKNVSNDSSLDRNTLNAALEWRTNRNKSVKGQYRLKLALTDSYDNHIRQFDRYRIKVAYNYRKDKRHTFQASYRYGYRNQNEATFEGYDQDEHEYQWMHFYSPYEDKRTLITTLYAKDIYAEEAKFSYPEYGIRLIGRYPVNQKTILRIRAKAFNRAYEGDFSNEYPYRRKDHLYSGSIDLEYQLRDQLYLQMGLGYQDNNSNIPLRDYEGMTYLLGLKFN